MEKDGMGDGSAHLFQQRRQDLPDPQALAEPLQDIRESLHEGNFLLPRLPREIAPIEEIERRDG